MKANFALDLSPDGLTLLHRSGSGWTRVGEAALDAPDLGDTLKLMRSTASALEGGGVMTKLILPESHVLYTRLPIPEGDAEAQEAAIRAGLDGLTPYKVEELVFDWQPDGEGAQVAVVARETLDEAETFAAEHRFNPVCFVAAPGDGRFPGEPWFGLTGTAAGLLPDGETLERDAAPPAEPAPAPEPEEEETAAAADEAPAGAEAPPTESTEQDPSPEADDLAEPDIPTAEAQDRLPEADDPAEPDIPAADAPEAPAPPPDDSVPEPPGTSAATRAAFATQRAGAAPEAPRPVAGAARFSLAGRPPPPAPKTDEDIARAGVTAPEVAGLDPAPATRRRARPATSAPRPAPAAPSAPTPPRNEAEALTVFGARDTKAEPRRGGALLGIWIAGGLAAVALAAYLLWPGAGEAPEETLARVAPDAVAPPAPSEADPTGGGEPEVAAPDPAPAAPPPPPDPARAPARETAELPPDAPAGTAPGLADRAPAAAGPTLHDRLDDLYIASIDPVIRSHDAVALSPDDGAAQDEALPPQPLPPEPGNVFDLDERGLVRPTPEGALSPEGVMVHTGPPEVTPPQRPASESDAALETAERTRLAGVRPRLRPGGLVERNERATLGGYSRVELANFRPAARPASAQQAALAAAATRTVPATPPDRQGTIDAAVEIASASPLAIARSRPPGHRPDDFASLVATARQAAPAVPASARVTPRIPTSASVAKQATVPNAINLGKLNLIGVYGSTSNRRALVRLGSGRYVKLKVGDRVDGGRVAAIGDSELRYIKSGRNIVLRMPGG